MSVQIAVSHGEVVDKVTILEIKKVRITLPEKWVNVNNEWQALQPPLLHIRAQIDQANLAQFDNLVAQLKDINTQLWEVEDALRAHERAQNFGASFVELARSVYHLNDQRADLKKQVNALSQSSLVEEKSYEPYRHSEQ